MKKNCHNCIHLEYVSGDYNDPEGFVCHKRDYWSGRGDSWQKEKRHQKQLDGEEYRLRAKKCHEQKSTRPDDLDYISRDE
jgi:hypothetical protein